jgi:hypothetical protein
MLFYRDKRRTGLPIMPIYRIYHLADGSHIPTPPDVIDCADEQEAIGKAAQAANGKAVELWEGARFIVRFPSDEGWSASITCVSSQAISRNQPSSRSRIQLIGTVTDQPPKIPKPIVVLQSSTIFTVPRSACSPKITTLTLSSRVISNPSFPNGTNYSSSVG